MFNSISKLFGALNALSENVLALAGSIGEMNVNLRHRVGLDAPPEPPALAHQPAQEALLGPAEQAPGSPARPRGRRKAA
jgi:hypothetical protein